MSLIDPTQSRAARTPNAIDGLNGVFGRRTETRHMLPGPGTVLKPLRAMLGQVSLRKVDGLATLARCIQPFTLDHAAGSSRDRQA
ncbi:hypothetical protein [Rhodosalinus sediminis]|uniref:hypothetical protein n=1 Tax=Rhodosalinus sediminis TaxID=1940533 RepID=UPI002355B4E8|nr:hypothetical protein [Rhodosalinus sediminis]